MLYNKYLLAPPLKSRELDNEKGVTANCNASQNMAPSMREIRNYFKKAMVL